MVDKKKTMVTAFNQNLMENDGTKEFLEERAVHAFKSGNFERALRYEILPIERMQKDNLYKKRFVKGVYDPVLIKAEIAVLDKKEGGFQYLRGERFTYIRDYKIYKRYGYDSFVKWIEEDTPYSVRAVYDWMNICKNYTYDEAVDAGSKLTLIHSIQLKTEEERAEIVKKIADEDMSYRDAKVYIAEKSETDRMTVEDVREDAFYGDDKSFVDDDDQDNDIDLTPSDDSDSYTFEPIKMSIYSAGFSKKNGLTIDSEQANLMSKSKMKYTGILMFENELERRAVIDLLNTDTTFIKSLNKKVADKLEEYEAENVSGPKDKIRARARAVR